MEPTKKAPETPLGQLRGYLVDKGYDVPTDPEAFPSWVQEDGRLTRLHKVLLDDKEGAEVAPDYGAFESALFTGEDGKKKVQQAQLDSGNVSATTAPTALAEPSGQAEQPFVAAPGDTISALQPIQMAPGDDYITAGVMPTMEQIRADEARRVAEETPDTFMSALGKGIGNIPGDLVRMGGNALDYLGDFNQRFLTPKSDVAPGYEDQVGVVTDNKASDQMGAAMREKGASMKYEVSANARKSVLDDPGNGAAWGNLLGQAGNSIVQIMAASAVGGPLAGVTMGGAMGVSATKDAAREAGLSETEAMYTATALAPIQGALEELGMGFITKNKAVTGLLTKTLIGRALADGGGKLSETALAQAVAKLLPEVVKRGLKGGAGEAVTEFLQAEAEGITKLTADRLRGNNTAPAGKGRYGISVKDALVKQPLEQAVGGFVGGGVFGSAFKGNAPTAAEPAIAPAAEPSTLPTILPSSEMPDAARAEYASGRWQTVELGLEYEGRPVLADVTQDGKFFYLHDGKAEQGSSIEDVGLNEQAARLLTEQAAPAAAPVAPEAVAEPVAEPVPAEVVPESVSEELPLPGTIAPETAEVVPEQVQPGTIDVTGQAEPLPVEEAPFAPRGRLESAGDLAEGIKQAVLDNQPFNTFLEEKRAPLKEQRAAELEANPENADAINAKYQNKWTDFLNKNYESLKAEFEALPAPEPAPFTPNEQPAASEQPVSTETGQPVESRQEPLARAEPATEAIAPLTPEAQAANNALDALDRYNALGARAQKGKEGNAARGEIGRAAAAAGLTMTVDAAGKVTVTNKGKRVTRTNEYTGTTPAANHVPLAERPEAVRPFLERVIANAAEFVQAVQGIGVELRGKPLSANELKGAVADIQAGKNTLRAQLVLDALENAHRRGYVEKSEGTGLATRKYTVPVDEYVAGDVPSTQSAVPLADAELDALYASDPAAKQAVDDYVRSDGTIDFAKMVSDGPNGLQFLFDIDAETANKLVALANERTNPTPAQTPSPEVGTDAGSQTQGPPRPDETASRSGEEVAPEPAATTAALGIPEGQKERQHPLHYDDATQAGLTPDQRYYTPRTRIGNAAEAKSFIDEHGLDNAYKFVMDGERRGSDGNEIEAVVLDEVRGQVRSQLEDAAVAAAKAGKPEEAARLLGQSLNALGERAKERTKAAQVLAQYQGNVLTNPEKAKDDFVASVAVMKETAAKKNAKKGKELDTEATTRRKATVDATLADAVVQDAMTAAATQAVTGEAPAPKTAAKTAPTKTPPDPATWGSSNKVFTKESAAASKAALRKLGLSSVVPPELINFVGFHMEAGARSFAEVSKRVLRDLGNKVKPLLADAYEQAKAQMIAKGDSGQGFDGKDGVAAALNKELADALADRIVSAAAPKKPGVFDPVREMLDTLTKKVSETLDPAKPKPKEARDAIALALNNRAEYANVFEQSKALVEAKIDALKISDSAKQDMREALEDYHAEIIGQSYADSQFNKAMQQAEEAVYDFFHAGKDRSEKTQAATTASDADIARNRQAVIDEVTKGVTDPATKQELADSVGDEFDQRTAERQQKLRNKNGIFDANQTVPPKPVPKKAKPMSTRVRELLNARATVEQVAGRLAPDVVAQGIKDLKTTLDRLVREHADVRNAAVDTLVDKLVKEANLTPAQAKAFADVVKAKFAEMAANKANTLVGRILAPVKAKLPAGKSRTVVDKLSEALDLADATGGNPSPAAALLTRMAGIPDVTVEDIAAFRDLSDKLRAANTPKTAVIGGKTLEVIDTKARDKALADLLRYGAEKMGKVTWWAKTRAMQYAFRLSGPDTQGRNLKSNVLHTLMEQGIITPLYNIGRNRSILGGGAGFRGGLAGQKSGVAEAAYTMKTGYTAGQQEKFGDNSPLETSKNKALAAGKYVGRLMVAGDQLTSIPTENSRTFEVALQIGFEKARIALGLGKNNGVFSRSLRDAAYAEANEILYKTKEAIDDIHQIVDQEGLPEITLADVRAGTATMGEYTQRAMERDIRTADLLRQARAADNPELVNEAQEYARIQTLNGDVQGRLGQIIGLAQQFSTGDPVAEAVMTTLMPFMRIPANSLLRKAEWGMPLITAVRAFRGYTSLTIPRSKESKYTRELTSEEQDKMYLRAAVGTAAWAGFGALLQAGIIGLSGPPRGKDDEDLLHPPMSIWMGDWSMSYKDTNLEYPLTIMAATADYARKQKKKGVDPTAVKLMTVAAIHTGAWAVTTGPLNGPSDLASVMIQARQGNYEGAGNFFEKMVVTPFKTSAVPALLSQTGQAWREYDGQAARERKSNSLPEELMVSFFGFLPYADVGEDKISLWGDAIVMDRNGQGVFPTDEKRRMTSTLVHLNLMPARQAPTDDRLTLFDPSTGDQVTPLSDKEFHDYAVMRGQLFYQELTKSRGTVKSLMEQIEQADTFAKAKKFRDMALTNATDAALKVVEANRAATSGKAEFKLGKQIRTERDAKSFRTLKESDTADD